jgi:hypothetical protein
MLWNGLPLEFHRAYNCAPPTLLFWKLPAGYCTCKTGPDVELLPGAGELGKGSSTKTRLEPPFSMRPLERPQLDVRKDWVSLFARVAEGNGRLVLVVSENCDATDAAGVVDWESACTPKRTGKNKASGLMVSREARKVRVFYVFKELLGKNRTGQ